MRIYPVIQIVIYMILSVFVIWYSRKRRQSVAITSGTLCLCIYKIIDAWISNNLYSIMEYLEGNQQIFIIAEKVWNALLSLLIDILLIIALLQVKKHRTGDGVVS